MNSQQENHCHSQLQVSSANLNFFKWERKLCTLKRLGKAFFIILLIFYFTLLATTLKMITIVQLSEMGKNTKQNPCYC